MSKKRKYVSTKVGDVVLLDYTSDRTLQHFGSYPARILKIIQNSVGDTIITYDRLDGIHDRGSHTNIHWVAKVLEPAPYVIKHEPRKNILAQQGMYSVTRKGALMTGTLEDLLKRALADVKHVDLLYGLNTHRAEITFNDADYPGKVAGPTALADALAGFLTRRHHLTLRWKTFRRWVHANAQRLVLSKKEARVKKLEYKKMMDDDLMDKLGLADSPLYDDFDQVHV